MTDFSQKRVLITGAASGIGRLMAKEIGQAGGELILWDINEAGLREFHNELLKQGIVVTSYICDLSVREMVQSVAETVLKEGGAVDILINNAGIISGKTLLEIPAEMIEKTFQVNTLANFWTVRAFLPAMFEKDQGHIITIASAAGLVGSSRLSDYSASKFAAVGFTESLRMELKRLGSKVRTTVVCPFFIDTGMFTGAKTRFNFLLPILTPEYSVRRILRAIRRNKARLIMPRFAYLNFPLRLLPVPAFDWLMEFFGINKSMDEFTGRGN
ncbi:MAG: SDR family oxidoreductase [Fidelibacterota bacterium]